VVHDDFSKMSSVYAGTFAKGKGEEKIDLKPGKKRVFKEKTARFITRSVKKRGELRTNGGNTRILVVMTTNLVADALIAEWWGTCKSAQVVPSGGRK